MLIHKGITSGLYATPGSGVCKAGKRKGLWKEVDNSTTEMLPHISSVLKMFYVLRCLDSSIGLSLDKYKELWSCNK